MHMSQFLTVKEAASTTGKSPSAIRRIIYPIIESDSHPDRESIRPTPDEVRELRMRGDNFAWRISEEFLRSKVPAESSSDKNNAARPPNEEIGDHAELITMLRDELAIKNQQISQQSQMLSQQMELISGLSERLREGNVLIGTLQQQSRLSEGRHSSKQGIVDAKSEKQDSKSQTSKGNNARPTSKAPKTKKGFFVRLFG